MALTDANGELAAFYEYDAWGNVMTEAEKTGVDNPYRYSTKEWDEKSGLYYFGFRYYCPEIGRWTQRDPAGIVEGLNLYPYGADDPVGAMDAWGMRHHADGGGSSAFPTTWDSDTIRNYVNHCRKLESEVQNLWGALGRLKEMYLRWKPGETWSDYGLGPLANASGYRSEDYWNSTVELQREVDRIEGNLGLTIGNALQLMIIGGGGYISAGTQWVFKRQNAVEQWWMTRITIEFSRTYTLWSRLKAVYDKQCWRYEKCKGYLR